jgi:hypothetical protein
MRIRYGFGQVALVLMTHMLLSTALCSSQSISQSRVLGTPVDETTRLRFFYEHDIDNHFYQPLIFQVVPKDDRKRYEAPLRPGGQYVSITASEMQTLLGKLSRSNISWKESDAVEIFGPTIPRGTGYLDVTVVSSRGTARGSIARREVCEGLGNMDSAIDTPRALWEFQLYRWINDCKIRGFDPKKYPDHWK